VRVRDIMTSSVITVSGDTPTVEAGKIMEFHEVQRLPVVDRGKLVGLVSERTLEREAPSQAASLSRWELGDLLSKMAVTPPRCSRNSASWGFQPTPRSSSLTLRPCSHTSLFDWSRCSTRQSLFFRFG